MQVVNKQLLCQIYPKLFNSCLNLTVSFCLYTLLVLFSFCTAANCNVCVIIYSNIGTSIAHNCAVYVVSLRYTHTQYVYIYTDDILSSTSVYGARDKMRSGSEQ